MSSHSAYPWKHPARNLTNGVTNPLCYQMTPNRHGRRARKLAWRRFYNAMSHGLPGRLPVWCGPKPKPAGPCGSVPAPNPKPEPVIDHSGSVRKVAVTCC